MGFQVSGVSLSANGGNEKFELPPALIIYDWQYNSPNALPFFYCFPNLTKAN